MTIASSKYTSCGHLAVLASSSPWYGDQKTIIQLQEENESVLHSNISHDLGIQFPT